MISIILIVSLLLESAFSNLLPINSIFIPLFVVTSFTILYPYFKKNKFNFIIVCMIMGLMYDIVFSNSLFVNVIAFSLVGIILMICYNYVKYNIYTANIINLIILISYRIITYIILLSINYIAFNNKVFLSGIYSSILMNIIYGIVLFYIADVLSRIFNRTRVE